VVPKDDGLPVDSFHGLEHKGEGMTLRANARLAGAMFLLYIATGLTSLALSGSYSGTAGAAVELATVAQHAPAARLNVLLTLLQVAYAVGLGVTLYALTRDQDAHLARFAMCCRVGEGLIGAVGAVELLALVSFATGAAETEGLNPAAANALGTFLLRHGGAQVAAACFAVGSTLFCYLFLRARSIPATLAWLGVLASALLVIALPIQIVTGLRGPIAMVAWIPMAMFEVWLALWLIFKGVTPHGMRAPIGGTT
jgi:hypothetical protein